MHLHGFRRNGETGLLVRQEGADVVALVALELDDIADFFVVHDGAIAGELLLDDLEDLLEVEFAGDAGHGRQCLATITLLDADLLVAGASVVCLSGQAVREWSCTRHALDECDLWPCVCALLHRVATSAARAKRDHSHESCSRLPWVESRQK